VQTIVSGGADDSMVPPKISSSFVVDAWISPRIALISVDTVLIYLYASLMIAECIWGSKAARKI
jgi:hypothetical protein